MMKINSWTKDQENWNLVQFKGEKELIPVAS